MTTRLAGSLVLGVLAGIGCSAEAQPPRHCPPPPQPPPITRSTMTRRCRVRWLPSPRTTPPRPRPSTRRMPCSWNSRGTSNASRIQALDGSPQGPNAGGRSRKSSSGARAGTWGYRSPGSRAGSRPAGPRPRRESAPAGRLNEDRRSGEYSRSGAINDRDAGRRAPVTRALPTIAWRKESGANSRFLTSHS